MALHVPLAYINYHLKEDASLPAMFNPLYSSTNEQLFKAVTMKIMYDLPHHMPTTKSTLYAW